MPAASLSIAQQIQTLAQGIQINSAPAYKTVLVGVAKDITNLPSCLEITASDDHTERKTMNQVGGQVYINDSQIFQLRTTVDFTDTQTAWTTLWALRDALTELFHASAKLGALAGVEGTWIEPNNKYEYVFRNGQWYLSHMLSMHVRYGYMTTLTT